MQIEPIYPPSRHVLPKACADCGEDVRCDKGFAILDAKPGTYLCFTCANAADWSRAKRWEAMLAEYWKKIWPLALTASRRPPAAGAVAGTGFDRGAW